MVFITPNLRIDDYSWDVRSSVWVCDAFVQEYFCIPTTVKRIQLKFSTRESIYSVPIYFGLLDNVLVWSPRPDRQFDDIYPKLEKFLISHKVGKKYKMLHVSVLWD